MPNDAIEEAEKIVEAERLRILTPPKHSKPETTSGPLPFDRVVVCCVLVFLIGTVGFAVYMYTQSGQ